MAAPRYRYIARTHPDYREQTHTLRPYAIEPSGSPIIFCAGEVSNNVWCFHVPAKGQPGRELTGMSVNERRFETGRLDDFDRAIAAGNNKCAIDILIASGLSGGQADELVSTILENPAKYGF